MSIQSIENIFILLVVSIACLIEVVLTDFNLSHLESTFCLPLRLLITHGLSVLDNVSEPL